MQLDLKKMNLEYELPRIKYDLSEFKNNIQKLKDKYGNLVVTEDDISGAKKLTADLNKLQTEISRKRIDTIKLIFRPISEFENELKETEKELKELTSKIKSQLDDYEQLRKDKKKEAIKSVDAWQDYMVFNEKWLNKSFDMADIKKEIDIQQSNFQNHSLLIATTCANVGLNSEKYLDLLKAKQEVKDIINLINNDIQVKKEYKEVKEQESKSQVVIEDEDIINETKMSYSLKITGTRIQLKALRQFIDDNGMTYEKLDEN